VTIAIDSIGWTTPNNALIYVTHKFVNDECRRVSYSAYTMIGEVYLTSHGGGRL